MVKLFVGNLADTVDSYRLKNLFLQYVHVQECDVLKNYAFVHVVTDEDAELVISKLEKYNLEGREIHIERSTSRLRKEPGMSDKCFTCGACDHKTPSCPYEPNKRTKAVKRLDETNAENNAGGGKKASLLSSYLTTQASSQPSVVTVATTNTSTSFAYPKCWGYKVGGGNDSDPELPCPQNPELRTLYEQYMESRTRYFFHRDRLAKELRLQSDVTSTTQSVSITSANNLAPIHLGTIDLTKRVNSVTPSAPVLGGSVVSQNYVSSLQQSQPATLQQSQHSNLYGSSGGANVASLNSSTSSVYSGQTVTDVQKLSQYKPPGSVLAAPTANAMGYQPQNVTTYSTQTLGINPELIQSTQPIGMSTVRVSNHATLNATQNWMPVQRR